MGKLPLQVSITKRYQAGGRATKCSEVQLCKVVTKRIYTVIFIDISKPFGTPHATYLNQHSSLTKYPHTHLSKPKHTYISKPTHTYPKPHIQTHTRAHKHTSKHAHTLPNPHTPHQLIYKHTHTHSSTINEPITIVYQAIRGETEGFKDQLRIRTKWFTWRKNLELNIKE